jgi:hypothetical protein
MWPFIKIVFLFFCFLYIILWLDWNQFLLHELSLDVPFQSFLLCEVESMIEWIEKPLCFENNSSSIYAKFGSNCSKDFWEKAEMWKANGHKVTTIPHIDLWYRYAKNMLQWTCARSHVAYYVFRAIKCAKSKR